MKESCGEKKMAVLFVFMNNATKAGVVMIAFKSLAPPTLTF